MAKTIVTEEFDNEGRLVKRITTTETSDTYTTYKPDEFRPFWRDYLIS